MIELRKMKSDEFLNYLKFAVDNYASEKQKGEGLNMEDALRVAKDSFANLLPLGLESKDQFLFSVIEKSVDSSIGVLWFAKKMNGDKPYGFIYDIELIPERRGKGLGKVLLNLAEEEIRKAGCKSIGLHVFGHNVTAVSLYEKSGFHTTNRMMRKDLE
jgi:ribosomal protein S18 acetylase RimI-like enzyme